MGHRKTSGYISGFLKVLGEQEGSRHLSGALTVSGSHIGLRGIARPKEGQLCSSWKMLLSGETVRMVSTHIPWPTW